MNFNTASLEIRQAFAALVQLMQTDPLMRIEIARAITQNLKTLDFVEPLYDLQTMPQLVPCANVRRASYYLQRFSDYFNKPIYRPVFTKVGNRMCTSLRRMLTAEEVIHLRGMILRPNSEWARATRRDHKAKHPELYATKAQIKEQQATNTGRYAYRRNRPAQVAHCA